MLQNFFPAVAQDLRSVLSFTKPDFVVPQPQFSVKKDTLRYSVEGRLILVVPVLYSHVRKAVFTGTGRDMPWVHNVSLPSSPFWRMSRKVAGERFRHRSNFASQERRKTQARIWFPSYCGREIVSTTHNRGFFDLIPSYRKYMDRSNSTNYHLQCRFCLACLRGS